MLFSKERMLTQTLGLVSISRVLGFGNAECEDRSPCYHPTNTARDVVPFKSNQPLKPSGGATALLFVVLALTLALAVVQPAAAAAISIDSERDGGAIDIHASAMLNADAVTAWHVLTDYNRYTEFIPDLRLSRVVARRGSTVTVQQSGDAVLWPFNVPLDITFEVQEIPPYRLKSRATAGSLRALTSSYTLTPDASGLRLSYVGRIAPGFALFGPIEETALAKNVARQFQALADEIERQSAAARSRSIAGMK
jgi:hypothetical protein